jgi:predicted ester cyclase
MSIDDIERERERERWRRLVRAHVAAENAHDLPAIMATFAEHAIGVINEQVATTPDTIAQGHALFGLSATPGIFTSLQVIHEREHFTDEEIVYEGRFHGVHTGAAPGFPPPSGQTLDLPYIVVYRFDREGKLVSERARIDFSPIYRTALPQAPASAP